MQINRNIVPVTDRGNQNISPLINGNKWESSENIAYNFATTNRVISQDMGDSFLTMLLQEKSKPLAEDKREYIEDALNEIETFTETNFVEVDEGEVTNLTFSGRDGKNGVRIYSPNSSSSELSEEMLIGDDMFSNPEATNNNRLARLGVGYILGLKSPTGSELNSPNNLNIHDMGATVMLRNLPSSLVATYQEGTNVTEMVTLQTYMPHDIAALQHLYWANHSYNSGHTKYEWSIENVNEDGVGEIVFLIDGIKQELQDPTSFFQTIWDGNGFGDVYDFSAMNHKIKIDLRPGWVTVFGGENQHAILRNSLLTRPGDNRSLIEVANAGSGDDAILGNQVYNRLFGNEGRDFIRGFGGDDFIDGGPGVDTISGDAGDDYLNGGEDIDFFIAIPGMGNDTILDFDASELGDVIQVENDFGFTTNAEILAAARQEVDDTVVRFSTGNDMTLRNVSLEELGEHSFSIVNLLPDSE